MWCSNKLKIGIFPPVIVQSNILKSINRFLFSVCMQQQKCIDSAIITNIDVLLLLNRIASLVTMTLLEELLTISVTSICYSKKLVWKTEVSKNISMAD